MNSLSLRRKYICGSYFKKFLKYYGVCLLVLVTLALLSILTGAFSVSKYDGGLSEKDFFDKMLYLLTEGELTFFKIFFNRLFYVLLFIAIMFITSKTKFLIVLNAVILMFVCYMIGMDIGIMFSIFTLRGIIFCVCVYIPLMLMLLAILILLDCIFIKKVQDLARYGAICNSNDFLLFGIALIIIIVLHCFIIPFFNNIIIIT